MNDIDIEFIRREMTDSEKDEIWQLLCECDDEFYPPLSSRNSSHQKDLTADVGTARKEKPTTYFNEMIAQEFILTYYRGRVIAFMTFRENYNCDALADFRDSCYITTVCVSKEFRCRHIMSDMYAYLENTVLPQISCKRISTRTWSLNVAQLKKLPQLGYSRHTVLVNDRGNGVDTVYFVKETEAEQFGFRRSTPEDIDEMMRIADAGKSLLKSKGIDQWQKGNYPCRELFEQDVRDGIGYVMTCNDDIAAICAVSFKDDPAYSYIEGAWKTPAGTRYAVAHRGAMAPEYQGRHLTGKWFDFICELAAKNGMASVRIDTHEENLAMRKVFANAGFEECGTVYLHGGDCGTGDPRIAYEKILVY